MRRGPILAVVLATVVLVALFAVAPWRDSFPSPVYEWNGHFYALTNIETDWVSAEAEAVAYGGHLITINDAQEQEFVVRTFLSPPDNVFWIGLTDQEQEGVWLWVSGEPVQYTNWEPREPNNFQDEDFGIINWHTFHPRNSGYSKKCTWNDADPGSLYYGIIEFASNPQD